MRTIKDKKLKKKIMDQYFSDKELEESRKIPIKDVLNWIEDANHFLYKFRSKTWKKDIELMKKIGW